MNVSEDKNMGEAYHNWIAARNNLRSALETHRPQRLDDMALASSELFCSSEPSDMTAAYLMLGQAHANIGEIGWPVVPD